MSAPGGRVRRRAAVALLAAVVAAVVAACGVEVPDDVAAEVRADETTTTAVPSTTETPTSDDELEQALIDNGYTLAEAECGAENLREELDDDEIASIVEADTIEDISASIARSFADALRPCVEGAAPPEDDPVERPDRPGDPGRPDGGGGGIGRMPDLGDDSEVDVSRSRFLSALISGGIPDGEARCIVEGVYAELDQDDINTLFHAADESDVPDDVLDTFMDITESCR